MIISKVVREVQEGTAAIPPGRFLKRREAQTKEGEKSAVVWGEVSDDEARNKVGHTFRSRSRGFKTILSNKNAQTKVATPAPPVIAPRVGTPRSASNVPNQFRVQGLSPQPVPNTVRPSLSHPSTAAYNRHQLILAEMALRRQRLQMALLDAECIFLAARSLGVTLPAPLRQQVRPSAFSLSTLGGLNVGNRN